MIDPLDPTYREAFRQTVASQPLPASEQIPDELFALETNAPRLHSTYVQIVVTGGFFACCMRCGSEPFPDRQRLAEAEADARAHGELVHIYPAITLRQHDNQQEDAP